jgi:hypothetical protein
MTVVELLIEIPKLLGESKPNDPRKLFARFPRRLSLRTNKTRLSYKEIQNG